MEATHIRVQNGNEFDIEDRYDGVLYVFEAGKTSRPVPILAAALFFGLPVDEDGIVQVATDEYGKVRGEPGYIMRRYGWSNIVRERDEDLTSAVDRAKRNAFKWYSELRLAPLSMALREVPLDGKSGDELPPPREEPVDEIPAQAPGRKMKV